jgi:NarL family two-component system response regulator LiaR
MASSIRILLVDDHPALRMGLRIVLEQAPGVQVVAEAGSGQEALALIQALRPDVAVLDCQLPDMPGSQAAAELQRLGLATRVLALSGHDSDDFLAAMHDAGAAGYLLKEAPVSVMSEAIRRVGRGETVWRPEQLARIAQWRAEVQRPWTSLTDRERVLLLAMSRGESNRDLARRLCISERTVEFHISNVLGKLVLPSRTAAVAWMKDHAVERWGG